MALTLVNTNDTFYPGVLNQIINVLQQPSGGQELGHYKIEGSFYTGTTPYLSSCIQTLSRFATPVSITVDTADDTPGNVVTPIGTGHLTAGGAQIYSHNSTAGAVLQAHAGGNYTMQY